MYKIHSKPNLYFNGKKYITSTFFGGDVNVTEKTLHLTSSCKYPQVSLKLPTNVVDINAAEVSRFSPLRVRDICGPVISSYYEKKADNYMKIDVTLQADPYVNKYDCRGAVCLSSSMQSNVPSPFSGNHTHLNMPASQWGQGYKYLSDHLHSAHYLTLRNQYREKQHSLAVDLGRRNMSTDTNPPLSSKDKLKKAVKDYGSTVIIFHVTISLMSLGGCYLLVSSGIDLVELLKKINIGEGTLSKLVGSNAGTFVIAYAVHKVFAPVRMAITLTATPFIVRYLRNIGFLKRNVSSNGGGSGK